MKKLKFDHIINVNCILFGFLLICNSCYSIHKNRIKKNQSDCKTIKLLISKQNQSLIHQNFKGKTTTNTNKSNEIEVLQDSILITFENDTIGFHNLFKNGIINSIVFIEDLKFIEEFQNYDNTSDIRNYTIFDVKELNCKSISHKKIWFKFAVCIGQHPTNGIIYYLEIENQSEIFKAKFLDPKIKLTFLQNYWIMA